MSGHTSQSTDAGPTRRRADAQDIMMPRLQCSHTRGAKGGAEYNIKAVELAAARYDARGYAAATTSDLARDGAWRAEGMHKLLQHLPARSADSASSRSRLCVDAAQDDPAGGMGAQARARARSEHVDGCIAHLIERLSVAPLVAHVLERVFVPLQFSAAAGETGPASVRSPRAEERGRPA